MSQPQIKLLAVSSPLKDVGFLSIRRTVRELIMIYFILKGNAVRGLRPFARRIHLYVRKTFSEASVEVSLQMRLLLTLF